MIYPVAIHKEKKSDYGVSVPDLPGCFSAGSTMEETLENIREAISLHLEGLIEEGLPLPGGSPIEILAKSEDWHAAFWAVIEVDLSKLSGKVRRLNITLPERVLRKIDAAAAKNSESRSGFIARLALQAA